MSEAVPIDLKWSLWSKHRETWDDRADTVPSGALCGFSEFWDRMQQSYEGVDVPISINLSPKKEIRYGTVTIGQGCAYGNFTQEWDDPEMLADTLGVDTEDESKYAIFCEELLNLGEIWENGSMGFIEKIDVTHDPQTVPFEDFMAEIDSYESCLIARSDQAWNELENRYDGRPATEASRIGLSQRERD
jgi:hypothetical protein